MKNKPYVIGLVHSLYVGVLFYLINYWMLTSGFILIEILSIPLISFPNLYFLIDLFVYAIPIILIFLLTLLSSLVIKRQFNVVNRYAVSVWASIFFIIINFMDTILHLSFPSVLLDLVTLIAFFFATILFLKN